jgi:DNA-binding response OmpR family regulator
MSRASALIIEDDGRLAAIFAEALRLAGYEPEIVNDGRIAQTRLQTLTPILILLDLHLPGVDGRTLLHEMRANERLQDCLIILATADAILAEELRAEADLVLLKPISFSQLRDLATRLNPQE